MIADARDLGDRAVLHADLCIVGTGPAAMALALRFDGRPLSVLMLEAGGTKREPNDDDGLPASTMRFGNIDTLSTVRALGGNANNWNVRTRDDRHSVRLLPFAAADFEKRSWLPDSGWPIGASDLTDHYRQAQIAFQLSDPSYDPEDWEEPSARILPIESPDVRTAIFKFGNADAVLDVQRRALERSPNITILHHATALEALTNESASHVEALRAASAPDRDFQVTARQFVLAAGGVSTAQLLLSSDAVQPGGLGNAYDNVGRYFMDHPLLFGGEFLPSSPGLFDAMDFYDLRTVRGTPIMGHLQLSDQALRRDGLLNLSTILLPRESNYQAHRRLSPRQQSGFDSSLRLRHAKERGDALRARDLWLALKGIDGVLKRGVDRLLFPKSNLGHGGWSALPRKARRFDRFEVLHQAEQAPHRENRITLSQERNRFGARRLHVDWRWHQDDIAATMRSQEVFARALRNAGHGEFRIARDDSGGPVMLSPSTSHYMGTTRMHEDPRQGVVDEHCRVHGVDNLFVASSSVFPTGGFANPTLTIVALALRLADRIGAVLGGAGRKDLTGDPADVFVRTQAAE